MGNLTTTYHNFKLYSSISVLCNLFNTSYRAIASPVIIFSGSIFFSISTAMLIIMNTRVFSSLRLVLIPVCVVNGGMIIFLGPTQFANVNSRSTDLISEQTKCFHHLKHLSWIKKKQMSMQPIKMYIGGCFFDRLMPLHTLHNSISNAITVLLTIRT